MTHNSIGKSWFRMQAGVVGTATFAGDNQEHRITLERRWGDLLQPEDCAYALWIGMNPSTAGSDIDDMTVRKEQTWTRMLGLTRYIKVNVGTYRSTNPAGLNAAEVVRHPSNLPTILRLATDRLASRVIVATGHPPPVLHGFYHVTIDRLRESGVELWCLGKTKDEWPRHSSRIGYSTPIVRFTL